MTATLPDPLRVKLAPLIRMLSSPIDGEALGACRAIDRMLQAAGLDFDALANALQLPAVPQPASPRSRPAKQRKSAAKARAPKVMLLLSPEQWDSLVIGLAEVIDADGGKCTEWERDFSRSLLDGLRRRRLNPTRKQFDLAERLIARAHGVGS